LTTIYSRLTRVSGSELRGIVLVLIGLTSLGFYYSWWFCDGHLASVGSVTEPPDHLTVDVFVTACGEAYELVERSLTAACMMRGPHCTWLLDDGHDPALAYLAQRLGAGYLTRQDRQDAKAGNINAALPRTHGDVILILDVDHVPDPGFLGRTLGCFADPSVGFVQVMPTFSNDREGWVARAATETSLDFYNPTSKGMDGLHSATKMGTNSLIRREALNSIGGYQPGLAEDLATSLALHAAGWRSRYVAEPLAPGLAPPDLTAWFTQQFKWARGVFEVLLTAYPAVFLRLNWGQRVSYAVRTTTYLIGPIILVHLALLIAVLMGKSNMAHVSLQQYFLHFAPLGLMAMLIRQLALRKWRHPSVYNGPLWRAVMLVFATWPIYSLAWIMALVRMPLSFRPTPKSVQGRLNPLWLLPQLLSALMLLAGVAHTLLTAEEPGAFWLLYGVATGMAIPQLGLIRPLLRPVWSAWHDGDSINPDAISHSPKMARHSSGL
jgi:cellulose synthase (UDP-forming)